MNEYFNDWQANMQQRVGSGGTGETEEKRWSRGSCSRQNPMNLRAMEAHRLWLHVTIGKTIPITTRTAHFPQDFSV